MADTFNSTVNSDEGWSFVEYDGTIDLSGNLTSNHFSQAFNIGECNSQDAGFFAVLSGGDTNSDVDLTLQFSNDRDNWTDSGSIVLDGQGASSFEDVGVSGNSSQPFHAYKWMRIKAAGQTGNTATTVTWNFFATKNNDAVPSDGGTEVEDSIE